MQDMQKNQVARMESGAPMSARFVSSQGDPRKLSMLAHQIARQHPGRRHHVHGPIQPMDRQRDPLWWRVMSVAIMAACTVYALKLAVIG